MPEEKIYGLTGEEVQEAILYRIRESMQKTCHLLVTNSYTSFRAEIEIHIQLSDYGDTRLDNHKVIVQQDTGLPGMPQDEREIEIIMEPEPPNKVRQDTGQPIKMDVLEGGKKVTKSLHYAARKAPKPKVNPQL